jgi:DNA-binding NarL/FixJ family response regulator
MEDPGTPIDVAVIDDHMVIHDGVRAMAEREPDMRFVGGATNPAEAIALLTRTAPALSLLDVRLGETNGLELCEQLRTSFPSTGILIFSAFCNAELLTQAIRAGAGGYVLKDTDTSRMPEVLREFRRTGTYFDPRVAGALLVGMVGRDASRRPDPGLSERERRIIQMVAEGASNYDIATEMNLSYHTVKFHVAGLLRRFGVHRRAELVKVAMERQILT